MVCVCLCVLHLDFLCISCFATCVLAVVSLQISIHWICCVCSPDCADIMDWVYLCLRFGSAGN